MTPLHTHPLKNNLLNKAPFFVLAPMDDVTDTVFRQIVADCAKPDLFITEFVNVDGLQSPGRKRLLHKLRFSPKEQPIIAQLWGLKPENFYKTTKELVEMRFAGVDLNMGCPVKTVIKNGACAALINNRELTGEIIDATRAGAKKHFPVSVKTRVGYSDIDLGWIEFLLSKKLDLLSIHGRTAKQKSLVPANWDLVGQVREMRDVLCPSTKIVGNGDVHTRQQGLELAKKHKLDGIMIGRGIFHDPFIFAQSSPWAGYTPQQKVNLYRKHVELFAKTWKNGECKMETLNKFCKIYINGFDGASEMRAQLMACKSTDELLELLSKTPMQGII
ncbi:tRNA-dihydrouridine synthase [Candidatus Saccharibacteria bacterium CG10_big_fil_rev_8_21_14_0_10_47_8]|nr:MAG: tRNA-dihydrouridine synthase [Candidatus Saccharibacteria bacterium CG10_big_fil_rev_8_21_14_0_10_47_8]